MAFNVMLSFLVKAKFRRKDASSSLLVWCSLLLLLFVSISPCSASFEPDSRPSWGCGTRGITCWHGTCQDSLCVCDFGWQGVDCGQCGGRILLNSTHGFITDGFGNYTSDLQCTWLIDSGKENVQIRLNFEHFMTECIWDHLYIFDGDSFFSPMIAAFSGPISNQSGAMNEIQVNSGRSFLYFYSDAAYNMSGFNLSYSINSCPRNCSGNGVCVGNRCTCNADFDGDACDRPICPNDCSGNGECDRSTHRCVCSGAFTGLDCSLPREDGFWSNLSPTSPPEGRSLHQAVVYQDTMYITGGEYFKKSPFLLRFNMKNENWEPPVSVRNNIEPEARFGHSTVVFNHKIIMFGGILKDGTVTDELWEYDIFQEAWTRIVGLSKMNFDYCCPIKSVGHTATVVNNVMIIIFGYNPTYGYVNHVQHFDLESRVWKFVKATGASVKGSFGHTSSYDHHTRLIYVFGGYHSVSSFDNALRDTLYAYDPANQSWSLLSPSTQPRYLHSSSIINGMLLIFGGSGHNASDETTINRCFSSHLFAYDISCDSWRTLDIPRLSSLEFDSIGGRYGHSAVFHNESIYFFGGFNGQMLNDLLRYVPLSCQSLKNAQECKSRKSASKCFWHETKNVCQNFNQGKASMLDYCPEETFSNSSELCSRQTICSNCLKNSYNCSWCGDRCSNGKCDINEMFPEMISDFKSCEPRDQQLSNCDKLHTCQICAFEHHCTWVSHERKCKSLINQHTGLPNSVKKLEPSDCDASCHTFSSCHNCTKGPCMWCSSQDRCIDSNAYPAIYPIGQCMEWTTNSFKCMKLSCSDIVSCGECLKNPRCGWCDDGHGTGVGFCHDGGLQGPLREAEGSSDLELDSYRCPRHNWFFTSCPLCQCNGHSHCLPGSSKCEACTHFTEGEHCDRCIERFYGRPLNGGTCTPCSCNGHSDYCHHESGHCNCVTKGIVGERCDKCDEQNNYVGNPQDPNGSCYYNLSTSYSYTFNMSKPDDRFFTRINFMNVPLSEDIDVEFSIECHESALVNISIGSTYNNSKVIRRHLYDKLACGYIKLRFPNDEHFGVGCCFMNTTFYVNVYNFRTPFVLQISFSQHRNLDILQFFLTFTSCFFALLVIAAILWKIKQRYELFRRRQQMFVELEQMAARPFGEVFLNVKRTTKNELGTIGGRQYPAPIALEPCSTGKAGVITLFVKLPGGSARVSGQTEIALASTLVSLNHLPLEQIYHEKDRAVAKSAKQSNSDEKFNELSTSV